MTSPKASLRDVDLEHVVGELVRCDESGVSGLLTGSADSTVRQLKAELDTLAAEFLSPPPSDEFADESDCRRAIELVERIGRDPTFSTQQVESASSTEQLDLNQIGPYQIVQRLGAGGMGAVYKALHTKLKKIVAIKVLPVERMKDAAAIARFEREMEAVGKLQHPNIVSAHDAGKAGDTHFLVMEYVDGLDLSEIVRRVGPLDVADACEIARQTALGLQEAHENNMVHRDIKPSNLMLANVGRGHLPPVVKILDLGLALLNEQHAEQRDLTTTGQMMGTLEYMAPEQGGDSHVVDIRADIYALGATLYKLLSGEAPFPSSRYDTPLKMIRALALEPTPSISGRRQGLPMELVEVINRMLAKDPAQRFAVPQQVAEALARFSTGANLAALLQRATTNAARPATDQSAIQTHQHITADSHETAPNIDHSARVAAPGETPTKSFREMDAIVRPITELPRIQIHGAVAGQPRAVAGLPTEPQPSTEGLLPGLRLGSKWRNGSNRVRTTLIAAAAMGGILLLGAVTLFFQTRNGTLVVEIDDPSITVSVVGEDVVISDPTVTVDPASKDHKQAGQPIKLRPGDHKLHVTRGDLEFDSDNFTLKRGEKVVLTVKLAEGQVQIVRDTKVLGQRDVPVQVAGDPDRRAAEWVLSVGGEVVVRIGDQHREIKDPKLLPTEPFELYAVGLTRQNFPEAELARLVPLQHFDHFSLGANITDAGLVHVGAMQSLKNLAFDTDSIRPVLPITAKGLEHIARLPNLELLTLRPGEFTGADMRLLQNFPKLRILHLRGHGFDDAILAGIKSLPIQSLLVESDSVTDAGLEHLAGMQQLGSLEINGCGQVTDASMEHIAKLSGLRNLNLPKTITDEGLAHVAQLRELTRFVLSGNNVTDVGIQKLAGHEKMTELQLHYTLITDDGVALLQGMPLLTTLVLNGSKITDRSLEHISKLSLLTDLRLAETSITDTGLEQLTSLAKLRSLDVTHTKVTSSGVAKLKSALPECKITSDFGTLER